MSQVDLGAFSAGNFDKGANSLKIIAWYFVNALLVRVSWNPFMCIKIALLRAFGAKIGRGLIIKNNVTIKFPWKLTIEDNVWLGEQCWIDNLDCVTIGSNVCISQGALLLTGNHDYKISSMPYRNAPIVIENGVWVGAKVVVCAGVTMHMNSIATVGSVITKSTEVDGIYQGIPAVLIRKRKINR